MTDTDQKFDRCARCGALKSMHWALPLASPGKEVRLCPKATYLAPSEVTGPTDDDAELQKLMESA